MIIPDPTFSHPGSEFFPTRIPDPHQRIYVFNPNKWFISFRKYDPGFSSRIRILTFYSSRIHGVKKAPDPDPDPQHCKKDL
jgi:hypothetical protein